MFPSRMQYDEKADAIARALTDIDCQDESLTVQSPATDADINVLVKRFGLDKRPLPPAAVDPSYFGDFTEAPTNLQDAIHVVREAQARFDGLPPDLRARFNNDPALLWGFVNDPRNGAEAVSLGLLRDPEAAPAPLPAAVVAVPAVVAPGAAAPQVPAP